MPEDRIKVHVENGWVILKGYSGLQVSVGRSRECASQSGRCERYHQPYQIQTTAVPSEVKTRIESAIRRAADSDAKKIQVEVSDHKVTLRGKVSSWAERREAERAAWAVPGVSEVEDHLVLN